MLFRRGTQATRFHDDVVHHQFLSVSRSNQWRSTEDGLKHDFVPTTAFPLLHLPPASRQDRSTHRVQPLARSNSRANDNLPRRDLRERSRQSPSAFIQPNDVLSDSMSRIAHLLHHDLFVSLVRSTVITLDLLGNHTSIRTTLNFFAETFAKMFRRRLYVFGYLRCGLDEIVCADHPRSL